MLLQALAAYAESDLSDDLADEAFEVKPVPYGVEIDDRGRFRGIVTRVDEKQVEGSKKAKTVRVVQTMLIPKSPVNRNSGVYPLLGIDSIQYVVGPEPGAWTKPGEHEKHEKHHAAFVELICEAAELTKDPWLKAAVLFYENPEQVEAARAALVAEKPQGGVNVALFFWASLDSEDPGGAIVNSPGVKGFWRQYYQRLSGTRHAKGGEGICMISGQRGPIAVTHDKIKGASSLGGQPAGVALMSFDKQAFCSYGWEQNQNGPVSPGRATAYVLALNDLMKFGRHRPGRSRERTVRTRTDLGSMGFLYWTRDRTDVDVMDEVDPGPDLGPDADMIVADMLDAPWTGKGVDGVNPNLFYLLTVAGNGGRLVVHDWHAESLANVQQNIRAWRANLQVPDVFNQGQPSRVPSVYWLIRAIMAPGMKEDSKLIGHWKLAMVRRALFGGSRFPMGIEILCAGLDRLRHAQGPDRLSPGRAGLIRLCVDDLIRMNNKGETALNGEQSLNMDHPAAICGRLMAIYETLQYQAQGEVGQTVADRLFALASTYPQLAFPRLEILSRAHLKKLRRDNPAAFMAIGRRIDELTEKLAAHGAAFPAQLSIEAQGRFAIGYHWQRAEDSRRIQEAKGRKASDKPDTKNEE